MTGCPNREQPGPERPENGRSLADGPEDDETVADSPYEDGTLADGSHGGEPFAQSPDSSDDLSAATWADSAQTIDSIDGGPVFEVTLGIPARPAGPFRPSRLFAPGESTDDTSPDPTNPQETAVFTHPGVPVSSSSLADTQQATIEPASAPSDATTDARLGGTGPQTPGLVRVRSSAPALASKRRAGRL